MSPIIPLSGWVVILPIIEEEIKTASGLILKDKIDKEKQNLGLVVAVPSNSPITSGCKVFYKPYAHIDCQVGEEKYYLVEFQDLCGVLTESETKIKKEPKKNKTKSSISFEDQGI
jgi:co-chaperonin GroES (HSP10)